jgi:XTP/dITP diphosphohydrolase
MQKLLIATKNAHKTVEFREALGEAWEVLDLCAHAEIAAPEETGSTFAQNASLKAENASRIFDGWVLADDSGLEVDALHGAPGVLSARYAGPRASDSQNRARLLRELDVYSHPSQRRARFRCTLALAKEGRVLRLFEGTCEGVIQNGESGTGGFGYDALFVPEGFEQSFGDLPLAIKNQLSHRARALEAFLNWVRSDASREVQFEG